MVNSGLIYDRTVKCSIYRTMIISRGVRDYGVQKENTFYLFPFLEVM
jgi:hypothetical protein